MRCCVKHTAGYHPSLTRESNVLPSSCLMDPKLASIHLPDLSDSIMYLNHGFTAMTYPELLSGSSLPAQNYVKIQSARGRDEMLFISPSGDTVSMKSTSEDLNVVPNSADGHTVTGDSQILSRKPLDVQNVHHNGFLYQGLTLSLGNEVSSSMQVPSYQNQYTNSGLSSLVSHHVLHPEQQGSQSNELKNDGYFSFDFSGGAHNNVKPKDATMNSHKINPCLHMDVAPQDVGTIYNSKYLKAAQELLEEVVNVHKNLKQLDGYSDRSKVDVKSNHDSDSTSKTAMSHPQDSTVNSSCELSPAERHDLQTKVTKLSSMLDEVDRRYKQYYHQMQVVASTFEMTVGCGAAKPYTALALRTISRHFRCLRDAIKSQIQSTRQSLGEQDEASNGNKGLSRLRYVDQQLRQQRSLQQYGMMRQAWRPQRGLPETSVSVLRAWLFEHFLHPYPKDSEKLMLARQTGLTRSQVANWFINARVRLWKPMVEEMYKEEFGDLEADSKSSPELASVREKSAAWEREQELYGGSVSATANGSQTEELNKSRADEISDLEMNSWARFSFQKHSDSDEKIDSQSIKLQDDYIPVVAGNCYFTAKASSSNQIGDETHMFAADQDVSVSQCMTTPDDQISLALGLQQNEEPQPLSGGALRGSDMTSSLSLDKAEYHLINPINQQHIFANPHLFSDFVA